MKNALDILRNGCEGVDFNEVCRQESEDSRQRMLDIILEVEKIKQVKDWVYVTNPVIGTCRNCGHRGFVNDPCIGLY